MERGPQGPLPIFEQLRQINRDETRGRIFNGQSIPGAPRQAHRVSRCDDDGEPIPPKLSLLGGHPRHVDQ